METQGIGLLTAAHAPAEDCTLVSADRAFAQVPGLRVFDWSGKKSKAKQASRPSLFTEVLPAITGNWRITFRFDGEDAVDVDLEDYH